MNLDYKLLHALAAVVKEQSFERAAASIFITQSAISQRIKQLEQHVSQPVLVRSSPLKATEVGKKLISHYYQVEQLERALNDDVLCLSNGTPLTVHIAVNADSLASWFIPALTDTLKAHSVELNLLIADEQYTIDKLKDGEVFGAITLEEKPIKGCLSNLLGEFKWVLVATHEFRRRYFSNGINAEALKTAPSAAFDQKDNMHIKFIEEHFGLKREEYPLHSIRSSEAFVMLAKSGAAFCLIAEALVKKELDSGELVNLMPGFKLSKKLYWQRWALLKGVHSAISNAILEQGQKRLNTG